jgi:cytochrome c551/c552
MFSFRRSALLVLVLANAGIAAAQSGPPYAGLGRAATAAEIAAWDIDVRPDFKGLPPGSGTVAKGQEVWEGKCASCHGVFGDSGEVFNPLIGGTSAADVKSGRVAKLMDPTGGRTTLMKLATVSTLWDYINRAMPWTQPKSLTTEEVYSVTAFLLNLAGVVPDKFTLTDKNIAEVQAAMPNRNGMTTKHDLWPGSEFKGTKSPDVKNTACMKDCATEPKVVSFLPDFARNAHGNLADQNRLVGPQRGADTTRPEGKRPTPGATASLSAAAVPATVEPKSAPVASTGGVDSKAAQALAKGNSCTACHSPDQKVVGPSWSDIAKKHAGKADYLAAKIKSGGSGAWGSAAMPPQNLSDTDAKTIAVWLAAGAAK